MQLIPFYKFESTGNDFIIIDNRGGEVRLDVEKIERICDRRFGIGGDGLILLSAHVGFDFAMEYYNSDGLPGSFCGNGGRAAVAMGNMLNLIKEDGRFIATDGPHAATIERVSNNLWHVELEIADTVVERRDLINTGSPHHIVKVPNLNGFDVVTAGASLRNHPRFSPDGCNVNFVRDHGDHLEVRTYERGVESETLSCGTGVTAAAIEHHLESPDGRYSMKIKSPGGDLMVSFVKTQNRFHQIRLSGHTHLVFEGKYYL